MANLHSIAGLFLLLSQPAASRKNCSTYIPASFAPGSTPDGTQFRHAFMVKRSAGAWAGTIELGRDKGGDFVPSGQSFVTGCGAGAGFTRWNSDFRLVDGAGNMLLRVEADTGFFYQTNWELRLFDCNDEALVSINSDIDFSDGLPKGKIVIADAHGGQPVATGRWKKNLISKDVLSFRQGVGGAGSVEIARGVGAKAFLIGEEWQLYAQAAGGLGLMDVHILGALAAYTTWLDRGDDNKSKGDFSGMCGAAWDVGYAVAIAVCLACCKLCAGGDYCSRAVQVCSDHGRGRGGATRQGRPRPDLRQSSTRQQSPSGLHNHHNRRSWRTAVKNPMHTLAHTASTRLPELVRSETGCAPVVLDTVVRHGAKVAVAAGAVAATIGKGKSRSRALSAEEFCGQSLDLVIAPPSTAQSQGNKSQRPGHAATTTTFELDV
jgi:hypothetical protein